MQEWSYRLIRVARGLVPVVLCLAIGVVSILPIGMGNAYMAVGPMLAFGLLFAWSISRPDDIAPWSVFLGGVVIDGLGGGPLGLWSFSFLIGYILAQTQRSALVSLPVLVVSFTYAVIAGFTVFTAWTVAAIYLGAFVDPYPLLLGCVISIVVFPFMVWVGGRPDADADRRFERV